MMMMMMMMMKEDIKKQNSDLGRTSYSLHLCLCHIVPKL